MKQSLWFDINHASLCPALKWKGQFTSPPTDPSAQAVLDHQYWCVYTQTVLGPDGKLAEPYPCSQPARKCHQVAAKELLA